MDKEKIKEKNFLGKNSVKLRDYLMGILVIIIVLLVGIEITVNYTREWQEECDNEFGKDNWTLVETTGTIPFYIGQCWKCVVK